MKNLPISKETLIAAIDAGLKPKYLFFWGHQIKDKSNLGKECLSQWYGASFEIDQIIYQTAEHYMMVQKALLFKAHSLADKIIHASHPGEAKRLGREIPLFDEKIWQQHRFEIVVKGNLAKFEQNELLKSFLLKTGDRIIVEASPIDKIWGIGLSQDQVEAIDPKLWVGLNLLGFALMKVRSLLILNE